MNGIRYSGDRAGCTVSGNFSAPADGTDLALILARGSCSLDKKIELGRNLSIYTLVVYNTGPDERFDGSDLDISPSSKADDFRIILADFPVGEYLNDVLEYQESNQNTVVRLLAINVIDQAPGVWEYTLLAVVILLGISFLSSVAMHFYGYRMRTNRLSGGGDNAQNIQLEVLSSAALSRFPIRVYRRANRCPKPFQDSDERANVTEKDLSDEKFGIDTNFDDSADECPAYQTRPTTPGSETGSFNQKILLARHVSDPLKSPETFDEQSSYISHEIISSPISASILVSPRKSSLVKSDLGDSSSAHIQAGPQTEYEPIMASDIKDQSSCSICIDDFVDGDILRQLPCDHFFHAKCIDPWLTKKHAVCPLCKLCLTEESNKPETV